MPIILDSERRSLGARLIVATVYLLLCLGALTMIYPFMITVSSSLSNEFDYHRFSPVPRSFFSRHDRFARGLASYFKDAIPEVFFPERASHWTTMLAAGDDRVGITTFGAPYLAGLDDPEILAGWQRLATDYADFFLDYPIENSFCHYDFRDLAGYLQRTYNAKLGEDGRRLSRRQRKTAALALLNEEWGVPYEEFFDIELIEEVRYPMHHASWDYPRTPKNQGFLDFKDAYRRLVFSPGAQRLWRQHLKRIGHAGPAPWPMTREHAELWPEFKRFVGAVCPASPTKPFSMKEEWLKFLQRQATREALGLDPAEPLTVAHYQQLLGGGAYQRLVDTPFPVPADAAPRLRQLWDDFVRDYYPARLMNIVVTPAVEARYHDMLRHNFRTVENYNQIMVRENPDEYRPVASFTEVKLAAYENATLWRNFVRTLPREDVRLHSAEQDWQSYLLARHGDLAGVNAAYGWQLNLIEEAPIPFAEAYAITFHNHEWRHYLGDIAKNYSQVIEFLFVRGRAFLNTVILVVLTIAATLTVNPIAAYALSRFRLRFKEQILLFLLATMAFPAAVRAIPGFLLMRDLHLLNTYAALVLPGLANGMSIFILKCFFDGLPRELYEAAAIDGASEWQVFYRITLPLITPILAINSLTAFIHAYNSWEWALIVCQDKNYWTLAVWLYQMQTLWQQYPYVIMAGFVIASIPTAIVFISCQKIILRGIVIPSMK